jgi:hypothetical protein
MKILFIPFVLLMALLQQASPVIPPIISKKKTLLITDQALNRVIMADASTKEIIWEWKPSADIMPAAHVAWFAAPSDVKPVMHAKYILVTASKGGVALVRISDRKTVFYAYAGGNTHSACLLPDGNIVSASSTDNFLMIFRTDTSHFPEGVYSKKIFLPFAHNVVWDKKREMLWSAGRNKLYRYRYNNNKTQPDLQVIDSMLIPDNDAHDLYPVYRKDKLWLTTPEHVFTIDAGSRKLDTVRAAITRNIKSVSSGPAGYPTIMMVPEEQWWTDEVKDSKGKTIFQHDNLKIYKARWLLRDAFSE